MKGRPPKPTALLRLEKPKLYADQRDRAELEPQSKANLTPRCPRNFSKAERTAWRGYAALLKDYGLFQGGNSGLLRRLATATVLYEELRKSYLETGLPRVGVEMLKVGRDMDAMEERLGLPSVARAKMGSLMLKAKKERDEYFAD